MHEVRVAFICVLLLIGAASSTFAQSGTDQVPPLVPSSAIPQQLMTAPDLGEADAAKRAAEVKRWIEEFTEWQEWSAKWTNRRERGWFTSYRERRERPAPPAWLADQCVFVPDDTDALGRACMLLAQWNDEGGFTPVTAAPAVLAADNAPNTVWWEHVQVDMMWPTLAWQSSTYGIIGMHTATEKGRLQLFTSPGVMLLNVPTVDAKRAWKVMINYGIGYRLFDFSFPGNRHATLNVNLAKGWMTSGVTDAVSRRTMDFVGFSIAFKK